MAIATALSHLNFTATVLPMRFSVRVFGMRVGAEKGAWCDHERDAGLTGGFRHFLRRLWLPPRGSGLQEWERRTG